MTHDRIPDRVSGPAPEDDLAELEAFLETVRETGACEALIERIEDLLANEVVETPSGPKARFVPGPNGELVDNPELTPAQIEEHDTGRQDGGRGERSETE